MRWDDDSAAITDAPGCHVLLMVPCFVTRNAVHKVKRTLYTRLRSVVSREIGDRRSINRAARNRRIEPLTPRDRNRQRSLRGRAAGCR